MSTSLDTMRSASPTMSRTQDVRDGAVGRSREVSGFFEIDACIQGPQSSGLIYVEGPVQGLWALGRHLSRRARAQGRSILQVGGPSIADPWREVALRCGLSATLDPHRAALAILGQIEHSLLLLMESTPTQWGRAVAEWMVDEAPLSDGFVVVLTECAPHTTTARVLTQTCELSVEETRLFWEAVVGDPKRTILPPLQRLEDLDSWCTGHSLHGQSAPDAKPKSHEETLLLQRLTLSRQSWSERDAGCFGSSDALHALMLRRALVKDRFGYIVPAHDGWPPAHHVPEEEAKLVATVLEQQARGDPWMMMRASELYAESGEVSYAERAMASALGRVTDSSARHDFWQRYEARMMKLPKEAVKGWRLRGAELAFQLGDVDKSLDLAHAEVTEQGESYKALWLIGCANFERGDLSASYSALDKAQRLAADTSAQANIHVQLAEVYYRQGKFGEAKRSAEEGLLLAPDSKTRLEARNMLGKLLLANGSYTEAEDLFAADASEAASTGNDPARLRANVNRAIVLTHVGHYEQAQTMLIHVLEEGERRGDLRAMALATHNLGWEAFLQHDWGRSLRYYTAALDLTKRHGNRVALANIIKSLAELKLRLGLIQEAEQTLVFGRQACGPTIPSILIVGFEIVAAQIHLVCGRTVQAQEALHAAMTGVTASQNASRKGECLRLAVHIALEEGNLHRARLGLARAEVESNSPWARAEMALLSANLACAAGEPYEMPALSALELAHEANSLEFETSAHILLARWYHAKQDLAQSRRHVGLAGLLRDRMADTVPDEIRGRFLKRREFVELARFEALINDVALITQRACHTTLETAEPSSHDKRLDSLVGNHTAMVALRAAICKIGPIEESVLVLGETGTGKELVAEALHEVSQAKGPLVKVNCAGFVEELLLSELFGHEKGAFTGATSRHKGRFELAEGGTIFLDEIGDISQRTQIALLRILQNKTFERVGGTTTLRSHCRVICATHRNLKTMVDRGEFRQDLYYRLNPHILRVPSLRERIQDLPLLVQTILRRISVERRLPFKRMSSRALDALAQHHWPGNIRELENVLKAATLFSGQDEIDLDDLTANVEPFYDSALSKSQEVPSSHTRLKEETSDNTKAPLEAMYAYVRGGMSLGDAKRQLERNCISNALAESGGNITQAAKILGMTRTRLSQLVQQYGFRTSNTEEMDS